MRKIQKLFWLTFVLSYVFYNTSAQSQSITVVNNEPLEVMCGTQIIDVLEGSRTVHTVIHTNKDGFPVWIKQRIAGNRLTGEHGKYSVNEIIKMDNLLPGQGIKYTNHLHVSGGNKTKLKYVYSWEFDPVTFEMRILKEKMVCD